MSAIKNTSFNYGGKEIPKHLGQFPVSPTVFIGRENQTTQIHEKLTQENNHVLLLVNGEGGIGKTTMATQYYFEYANYYSHLIWLVAETSIENALMYLALSLDIQFQNNASKKQKIREIIRVISTLKRPVLIIIDNANDIDDLAENYGLLRQFQDTHILLTSRIEKYEDIPTHKIKHFTKETANTLFKHYYKEFKEDEQELLDAVLEAIGYNTLVIELLAKNLHEFNTGLESHYSLEKLLKDIQDKGVLQIQKSTEIYTSYKLKAAKPEDIINSMYDISPLSDEEQQVLSIFGVLPTTVLPYQDIKQFLPEIDMLDRVLISLAKKGWIDYDEEAQSFKTNPIISEIARVQNEERLEKDTFFFSGLIIKKLKYRSDVGYVEGDFEDTKKMINYAKVFINHFRISNYAKFVLFDRLGMFFRTFGNKEQELYSFENSTKLISELHENNLNNIDLKKNLAASYYNLGCTYASLGNSKQAITLFENLNKLLRELLKNNPGNQNFIYVLISSFKRQGDMYLNLKKLKQATFCYEESLAMSQKLYANDSISLNSKMGLAISYEGIGNKHVSSGNMRKALLAYKNSMKLMEELFNNHINNINVKNNLAISYINLGNVYKDLGNLEQAKYFLEKNLVFREEVYENQIGNIIIKNVLAESYKNLGVLYADKLNNKEQGTAHLKKASTLWKELTEKHPNHIDFQNNYTWVVDKLKSLEET